MNVPVYGHLRLHFQENPITVFFPFLQNGFYVEINAGNILDTLCESCDLGRENVRQRIQTIFLNGKPVDDIGTAGVQDGDCLALSAAMPGLVGATMRSGGVLASFRHSISHRSEAPQSGARGGLLSIKLFNLLIKEMGPRFLERGVLVASDTLQDLLRAITEADWMHCKRVEFNDREINCNALTKMELPTGPGYVHLEVTFG